MPGVPPDAVDNLKRAFKNIFKRKGKDRTDTKQTSTPTTTTTASPATTATTPAPAAHDVDKPLPPTHPLTTGTHTTPQEAVPVSHADNAAAAEPGGKKDVSSKPDVSPVTASTDAQSDKLAPVDNEEVVAPKELSNGVKAEAAATKLSDAPDAVTAIAPHQTLAATKLDPAITEAPKAEAPKAEAPKIEHAQPNGPTVTEEATATDGLADATNEQKPVAAAPATTSTEAKAPTLDTVATDPIAKPAPGMSATSGPLEDFLEGGDVEP